MEIGSSIANALQSLLVYPTSIAAAKLISTFPNSTETKSLPEITLNEVSNHDSYDNCWIVVYDRIYDVTDFIKTHPGGEHVIMDHSGRDATLAFHDTGHSQLAIEQMHRYLIGELPISQRIFRTPNICNSVLLSGIPD